MTSRVIVTTGSRLHFGLLAHAPHLSRQFGGVGLMINEPGFQISVASSTGTEVADQYIGPDEWKQRVLEVVHRCRSRLREFPARCTWQLERAIPAHSGFGSGTQLALAVAHACSIIAGQLAHSADELAGRANRGRRSSLGIHGFCQGGFLVEVGKRAAHQISPIAARVEWPDEWRIVLVQPESAPGLSGAAEVSAFATLPAMSSELSARLCHITLLELIPGVAERDFYACSEGIYEFGRLVGDYFSPVQGGTYSTPQIQRLAKFVRQQGLPGVGQSSWGPSGFVLCPSERVAEQLRTDLLRGEWSDCQVIVTTGRNRGADIQYVNGTAATSDNPGILSPCQG